METKDGSKVSKVFIALTSCLHYEVFLIEI